jgi:serine/threonine-protein kinase
LKLPILDRLGTELAEGRYRISSKIGAGSMGQVYRAFDRNLVTEVVIKFPVAPEGTTDPSAFLDRFARESRAMIRLSHPHVVKVIDVGEDFGLPYAVMAYLEGGTLKDRLEPLEDGEPRPTAPETLHGWLMDIAKALDFIHAQGHIHRDVKPANILFDRHGNAFLADFGVVKSIESPDEIVKGASSSTSPGYLLGTPNYVAPELVMGLPGDGRGDQYALALTVHEALTGWNCMEGPTPSATLVNQTKVEPPKLSSLLKNVSPKLSEAIARGLAKEPGERFENCSSLARAILADIPPLVPGRSLSTPELISPASKGAPGRVPCPACGGLLPVVREHAGRRITCTRCRATAMVQLAAGTVQLLLVDPPPKLAEPEPPKAPDRPVARPKARVIEDLAEPIEPVDDRMSRRGWFGATLIGLGLLGAGGLGGWFLGGRRRPEDLAPNVPIGPVADGPIELNILHGTEKRAWLEAAAVEFQATPEGQGIAIQLVGRGSIQGLEDLLNGPGSRPFHAWTPANNANRELFEREWKVRRPGLRGPVAEAKNLVMSPMVFVFWKERLDPFLKKYGRVDFKTLALAMHEPGGWGTIAGKPEWGLFRFAHADPARSNSGLMTLALMAYEFTGKSRDLTLADITRPDFQAWLAKFERGVTRHGGSLVDSTGSLMEEMVARGPSQYDGLILYESLAIDFMKAAEDRWGELRVVYPEPTLINDHPYAILNVPWSDARHQRAAAAFLDFLMSPPVQIQALKQGFRPGNLSLNAGTPGGPLSTLAEAGFRLKIGPTAEAPGLELLDDLVSAFRRIQI